MPHAPPRTPRYAPPSACALSSMTSRSCLRASSINLSICTSRPLRWTGMIAFVRGVIAGSDADRLEQQAQAVGAVADADSISRADEGGEVVLEVEHLPAHDQVTLRKHVAHRRHDLFLDAQEFLARLPEPNRHAHSSL